jgi:hypothetical protein
MHAILRQSLHDNYELNDSAELNGNVENSHLADKNYLSHLYQKHSTSCTRGWHYNCQCTLDHHVALRQSRHLKVEKRHRISVNSHSFNRCAKPSVVSLAFIQNKHDNLIKKNRTSDNLDHYGQTTPPHTPTSTAHKSK